MASIHQLPLLFLIANLLQIFTSADDLTTYSAFRTCMQKNTNPNDHIESLIFFNRNTSYPSVLTSYIRNKRFESPATSKPLLIVTAKQVAHLQAAVRCIHQTAPLYNIRIRSGGHDYDGLSYTSSSPFIIVDMFNMRSISVDARSKTAWVQTGATLGELYYQISQASKVLAFPAGVCPTVGVGGHFSSGGYGNMVRKFGVTGDNIIDAQVVDAKGRLLNRATMGEDFFWAIRGGGGGSFGIVVSYKISLVTVPPTVTVFSIDRFADENGVDLLHEWQNVAPATDSNLFLRALVQQMSSRKNPGQMTVRVSFVAQYLGGADSLVSLLASQFPSLGLTKSSCKEVSWIQSVLWWWFYDPASTSPAVLLRRDFSATYLKRKSDYVQTPISVVDWNSIIAKMLSLRTPWLILNPYGGRMSQISSSALPFPHRMGNLYKVQYLEDWNDGSVVSEKDRLDRVRQLYSFMTPFVSKNPRSSFLAYRDVDIGVMPPGSSSLATGRVYGQKYFKGNFDRLVNVKTAVDPTNFFRNEQSIPTR